MKVSDHSLIGTIATCPKCNSMVEVVPESDPLAGQVAVGAASVDSQALTEDAIDAPEDVDPSSLPSGFAGTDSVETDVESESISSPLPPDWQSASTQRSRQIGMIVALSLASLIGAVLFFGWFVRSWQQKSAANAPVPPIETIESTEPEPIVADANVVDPTPEAETDTVDPETAAVDSTPSSTTDEVPPVEPEVIEPTPNEPTELIPSDLIPSDLMPKSFLDDPIPAETADAPNGENDTGTMDRVPDALLPFIKTLDLEGGEEKKPTLQAPPTLDDLKLDEAADVDFNPMLVATPPEPINLRRALAIEFALAPNQGSYPLSDLMLTISQLTGVPIQIDWVSFDLVGIDIRDEVAVPKGWLSAKEMLETVAKSIGAQIEEDQFMLTLSITDETRAQRLANIFDLTDFAAGRVSAAVTLEPFLPKGGVAAALDGERQDQQLAALAIEALRRIRGVTPKVAERSFRRWGHPATSPQLDWPVVNGGDAGPQYDAPLAMAGFLRRIARGNDATIFVNWHDANLRRMSPAQLTLPFTGHDAGTVIAKELRPFGLQARRVDDGHWWLGTESSYDRFPVVVWTEPLGADQAVFTQRITNAVATTGSDVFRMSVDSETGQALLLLPRYLVRQLPKIQNGLNLTKVP